MINWKLILYLSISWAQSNLVKRQEKTLIKHATVHISVNAKLCIGRLLELEKSGTHLIKFESSLDAWPNCSNNFSEWWRWRFENNFMRGVKGNGLYLPTRIERIYLERHFQIKPKFLKWSNFSLPPKNKINRILSIKMIMYKRIMLAVCYTFPEKLGCKIRF